MPFVATGIDSPSRHVLVSHGHERAAHAKPSELVRLSLSGKLDQKPETRDQGPEIAKAVRYSHMSTTDASFRSSTQVHEH